MRRGPAALGLSLAAVLLCWLLLGVAWPRADPGDTFGGAALIVAAGIVARDARRRRRRRSSWTGRRR